MEDGGGRQLTLERPTLTAVEVKAGLDLILQVMKTTMEKDRDYGVIPGCKLPSLWKPGSEKILATFRIGVDPEVEDLSTEDEARFRVKAKLFHQPTGIVLGYGIGEASSYEEKYRWRKTVCEQEFEETPEDRKRIVWKKAYDKPPYQVKQIRTNKADVSNTVLKMSKKRGQVDGTLTTTAASAVFTQDLEDLEAEVREAIVGADAPKSHAEPIKGPEARTDAPKPEPKAEPKAEKEGADFITFIPVRTTSKPDKNWKERFAALSPADLWYSTYNQEQGALLIEARQGKFAVKVEYVTDGSFNNIISVEKA